MGVWHGFLHGLTLSGLFFYKALWSIPFGVAVTAAVDVFVDKDRMARLLGRRTVRTTALGAAGGAASSACTFGAVTVAQSLFKKGASVEATFGFALAATNIVFELGILIYILLGGAYLGGELIAGVLLVVLMYLLVRTTLPVAVFERSRACLAARDGDAGPPVTAGSPACPHPGDHPETLHRGGVTYRFCSPACRALVVRQADARGSVRAQLACRCQKLQPGGRSGSVSVLIDESAEHLLPVDLRVA